MQHDFAEVTVIPRDTIHAHSLDTFFFVASFDLACHTLYGKLDELHIAATAAG
jgi:hypothetical protein